MDIRRKATANMQIPATELLSCLHIAGSGTRAVLTIAAVGATTGLCHCPSVLHACMTHNSMHLFWALCCHAAGAQSSSTSTSKSPFQSATKTTPRTKPADAEQGGDQRQRSIAMVNEGLEVRQQQPQTDGHAAQHTAQHSTAEAVRDRHDIAAMLQLAASMQGYNRRQVPPSRTAS